MNWAESFSFLPVMVIAPQKFALLFAFGSMTMYHGKKRPSVVLWFFLGSGGFPVEFMKGHKVGGIGFLEWRSAHWHHLRGENPLIPLCWFVQVWKLRRIASLPSLPVSNFHVVPALETPCFLGWDLLHCSKGQRRGVFQFVFVLWFCQMLV